jgi:hypothetical protein
MMRIMAIDTLAKKPFEFTSPALGGIEGAK